MGRCWRKVLVSDFNDWFCITFGWLLWFKSRGVWTEGKETAKKRLRLHPGCALKCSPGIKITKIDGRFYPSEFSVPFYSDVLKSWKRDIHCQPWYTLIAQMMLDFGLLQNHQLLPSSVRLVNVLRFLEKSGESWISLWDRNTFLNRFHGSWSMLII